MSVCASVEVCESMKIFKRDKGQAKGQAKESAHVECVCLHVIVSIRHMFGEAAYI